MVELADVKIWGEEVGVIRWNQNTQLASFQYHKKFLKKGWDLSPLKMPIKDKDRIYRFPELSIDKHGENTFKGMPGLLSDALPDRYGNQLINKWLVQNGRAEKSMNPVEQLCFIGKRGMGALEFSPSILNAKEDTFTIELDSLVTAAQNMLANRASFKTNLSSNHKKALQDIITIGTSAGGARPKAVIAYNNITGEVRSGQSDAPQGFEHWLLKLDGVSEVQLGDTQGWGRVEYAYYLMATECNIDMMECQLLEENNRAHFMTKRFDREGNKTKHHIQTLCGIQHYDYNNMYAYSYEQIFQSMRLLRLTYPEAEQMFRRMVFNVLATNCDDHTKNFSFRMKQGEKWRLSPAYDICYAYNSKNHWVNQQTLSINGKRKNISKADFMTIAMANSIKKAEQIIDEINIIINNWKDFASKANVKQDLINTIQNNLHTI